MKTILRFFLICTANLLFFMPLSAQISQGGQPISFDNKHKAHLNKVPFEQMPFVDSQALKTEDALVDHLNDRPWRFGENIEVVLNPKNSGVWDILENGTKIWRLGIYSPGAVSINLTFDNYYLPKGAELFIYSEDKKRLIGAFTDFNNQDDGFFATTLLQGERIIIEYNEPADAEFSAELNLHRVTHGYRGAYEYTKALGSSGSCNVNVVCPESAGMEDQIRSVGMLVSGGNGFCTGALINNTNNDGTPYFLSADHCYSNPGSVVFWFNWESETCANPSSSPSYNSTSGATNVARNTASDFWLMELNTAPTEEFQPYYAGWNRTEEANLDEKIWGIHHPSGDIKKISWADNGVTTSAYLGNTGNGSTHWRVGSWSDGTTTEPGSSGSPLFDAQGRIIGQLHGGYAACGNTSADWYGKLAASWIGGETPSTRLSDWLDAAGSGETAIPGFGPFDQTYETDAAIHNIIYPGRSYQSTETITPTVVIINRGTNNISSATVSYTLNGGAAVNEQWSGNLAKGETAQIQFPQITLTVGSHEFVATVTVSGDENAANNSLTRNFTVSDCSAAVTVPFTEGFEGGETPPCWHYEGESWEFASGGEHGNPSAPYSGSYNAIFSHGSEVPLVSKLIMPVLDISQVSDPVLSFWHAQTEWYGDQDELRIYYKTSATGNWTMLAEYTQNIVSWTKRTLSLPNPSSTYYVAFEATAAWGYGVVIDDIILDSSTSNEDIKDILSVINTYPNPVKNDMTLEFNNVEGDFNLEIINITGTVIFSNDYKRVDKLKIDLSKFSSGIYFLNVRTSDSLFVKKIIKQ